MEAQTETFNRKTCEVETTLKVIGGRWKVLIIRELMARYTTLWGVAAILNWNHPKDANPAT
jgi:DNA-binding HxlR family transcriptional regulator